VCLSVGHVREPCKMAEPIEMQFGELTRVSPTNHVLNGVGIPKEKGQFLGCPAH